MANEDSAFYLMGVMLGQAVNARVKSADLASTDDGKGADLVGFKSPGVGAVDRTLKDRAQEIVYVKDFGAVGDGVTDDAAAISAAIDYAATLPCPHLVVGPGSYFIGDTTIVFDLPNGSTIEFIGEILSTATTKTAVIIGSTTVNRFYYRVIGLKVVRNAIDSSSGSIGIRLQNLVCSYVDVRRCTNFMDGVLCLGTASNGGFSYNEIHLGFLHDNKRNLYLNASGVGYCNENNFFGGTFNHSSNYPAVATVNIEIPHFPTSVLNNNRFFGPSLEDNTALAVAAIINGDNNVIYWPRLENPGNQDLYQIIFDTNSRACQVVGNGFVTKQTNILDTGFENGYETRNGRLIQSQTINANGQGVIRARSIATSDARIFVAEDTSGNATAYINGNGGVFCKQITTTVPNQGMGHFISNTSGTDNYTPIIFTTAAGVTQVGSITCTATTTAYNTSSDYRLKENVSPMTGAVEQLMKVNPVTFNWKIDGSAGQGFIAHELQEVFPEAVTGEKDGTKVIEVLDENGDVADTKVVPDYQGVDSSFLIPTLVKAVQELQAQIDELRGS